MDKLDIVILRKLSEVVAVMIVLAAILASTRHSVDVAESFVIKLLHITLIYSDSMV